MMYHFTPIRLAKSKMPKSKALMRMWTLTYFWWECKIIQLLCKAILLHLFCWKLSGYPSWSTLFAQAFILWGWPYMERLPGPLAFGWVQLKTGGWEGSEFVVFIFLPLSHVFVVLYPLHHRSRHRTLSMELHFLNP